MNEKNNVKFEKYIDSYRNIYKKKPQATIEEMNKGLIELNVLETDKKKSIFDDVDTNLIKKILLIALIGLLNLGNILLYMFGLLFFVLGINIGLHEKKTGLIFFLSHGMTGFGIMIGSLIGNFIMSSAISECGNGLYIYLGTLILLTIITVLFTVLHNLSDVMKKRKKYENIIFSLFSIIFLLAGLLPYIKGILF